MEKTNNTSKSIQSLKGIAAIVVFFSHALHFYKSDIISALNNTVLRSLYNGQYAVILFFVISGFFYYKLDFDFNRYFNGIKKKIIKIYPPYIITLTIALILCNRNLTYNHELFTQWSNNFWDHPISLVDYIKQLTLIIPTDTRILNPPIWYLYIEVKMFILMPLIIGIWKKKGFIYILPIFIITTIIPKLPLSLNFCSIMLIGSYFKHISTNKTIINLFIKYKYSLIILGILIININYLFKITTNEYLFVIQAIGAAIIILNVYINNYTILQTKPLSFLGDISYEFYLIHFIILLCLRHYSINITIFIFISFTLSIIGAFLINKTISSILKKINK